MFEKVNPAHPDKVADRIAGALVDLSYTKRVAPHCAFEVLIGHGICHIIAETDTPLGASEVRRIVERIAGPVVVNYDEHEQDARLADNQRGGLRCGDNGIFCGEPTNDEENALATIARRIYARHPTDGKYLIDGDRLTICQSNADTASLAAELPDSYRATVNPLGYWTGGPDVDTGATNRKLGSDMGRAATGGGLHGKDLSKADVSVNIYAHIVAQKLRQPVEFVCSIGDKEVDNMPFASVVEIARDYVFERGGFESLAEWGLI